MICTNGKNACWLACCWCPAQPPPVERSDSEERDCLLALASAKKAGWSIRRVARKWLGLCPECRERGAKFPRVAFVLGHSGNPEA